MPIEPIAPIAATAEPTAETTAHAAFVAHEEAAAKAAIDAPDTLVTKTAIQLAHETISELEAQAHHGDQAAIRELALRAKFAEEHAAAHKAASTVEPPTVAHSPAEPGKGETLDESA